MDQHETQAPDIDREEFVRLPGLFRRWELERVLEPGTDFHIEEAGDASDGTPLFAVYRREPNQKET
jgi:hypothetical protein